MNKIRAFVERNGFYLLVIVCTGIIAVSCAWAAWMRREDEAELAAGGTQEFVQNLETAQAFRLYRPVSGDTLKVYEEIAYLDTLARYGAHEAVDLAANAGDFVVAAKDGVIALIQRDSQWGGVVVLSHADGVITRYAGLRSPIPRREGESVAAGDILGTLGIIPAEAESPAHLHFEVEVDGRAVNPSAYLLD